MNTKKLFFLTIICINFSYANTLKDVISHTLNNNPKIQAIQKNSEANKYYVDESYGDYYPTLNYEAYVQDKKSITKAQNQASTSKSVNGNNQQLKLDQVIYNGGLRGAKIEEQKHNYQATLISNISKTEKIVLETSLAYLNYLKNQELNKLILNNLEIHDLYLETAIETEEVSGDIVDRLLVENKILTANEKLIDIKKDNITAKNSLLMYYQKEIDGNMCRPIIDESVISSDIDTIVKNGVKVNYNVIEEIENIKKQKAILSQELSRFLPTLKVSLTKELDDGIDTEDVNQNHESARLTLSYNIFNGLKDRSIYLREKTFLIEAQKNLDDVTSEVAQKIKNAYSEYSFTKEKVSILKENVAKIKEILAVYEEQFKGGTRSFIDVLNQEEELYRKKVSLIEEQFNNYTSYFNLLYEISMLSDTISGLENSICGEVEVDLRVKDLTKEVVSDELESLLLGGDEGDGLGLLDEGNEATLDESLDLNSEEPKLKKEEVNIKEKVNKVFYSILEDIYSKDGVDKIDLDEQKIKNNTKNDKQEKIKEFEEEPQLEIINTPTTEVSKEIESEEIISEVSVSALSNIKELFFSDSELELKGYSIVLTTVVNRIDFAKNLIEENKIESNSVVYRFKTNGNDYTRVLYGYYNSIKEAKSALDELPKKLKDSGAYIDNINKNKKLYNKYKSFFGDEI